MFISQFRAKIRNARRLIEDESGAVTVDWVVLTAAVVILAIGAISVLDTGIAGLVTQIDAALGGVEADIVTTGTDGT
ncbi:MAG TPA: hypothetical protein VJ994_00145 [Paracoccaceae bacterium]|nr:hypothetical protein [Paracoccaceae bacterium]